MADNTIIQQGEFTSDGTDKYIALRSDVDWVDVWNLTNIAAATQWAGVTWHWQREMAQGDSILDFHSTASQIVSRSTSLIGYNGATYGGVRLVDSTDKTPGAAVATTAGTNATTPVYSTANTGRIAVGSIVRIQNTAHTNLNGLDFTVGAVTANTTFTLGNTLATAPGVIAGAGTYRYIAPSVAVYNMFNPRKRVIANITAASPAVVTTLVDHGYTTGQAVRMMVPPESGMTQLNGQLVTVTYINASTFSIGVDATGYTAFNFPLPAIVPFTPAQVLPVGQDASSLLFGGSVVNQGFIGMILETSATGAVALGSPGGSNADVIKWVAGKSFATDIA